MSNYKNSGIKSDNSSNDIDPEIADLIGLEENDPSDNPSFLDLFSDEKPEEEIFLPDDDIGKQEFPEITSFEEEAKPYFNDKEYYKTALSGEGAVSQRFHSLLSDFLKADNPKDKTLFRERLILSYWELASSIAGKINSSIPIPKKMLLRFGVVLPTLINKEQRLVLAKVKMDNDTGEPVYFADEWLGKIASGEIAPSITDETKKIKGNQNRKINMSLDKERGHRDAVFGLLKSKVSSITDIENSLADKMSFLQKHTQLAKYGNLPAPFTPEQKTAISEMMELLRRLSQYDRELSSAVDNMDAAVEKVKELEEKSKEQGQESSVDQQVIVEEFMTLKQMAKMSVGRKGNHLPILMQQYMRANIREIATRENVITTMAEIEKIDPGLFKRTFKRQTNRIIPHTIILPCYGEFGICWEPFQKFNRATSRGRIGIPLYPKDLKTAIIYALGDLRWQVAKETASYYWMEEGITGWYYQWFTDQKRRGDVKESFMADYYLWITKEADGMQKLDKDVRGVFWRNIPFPQEIKDKLRNRGFVYNELYKKDINIAMSDGY
ncbi:MAG: hypothetical protein RBT69_10215 [Spirochaetia bacterium]|jgi:hypothetical protein|nr:hypothetical protein [Spirochaetia bacterium]